MVNDCWNLWLYLRVQNKAAVWVPEIQRMGLIVPIKICKTIEKYGLVSLRSWSGLFVFVCLSTHRYWKSIGKFLQSTLRLIFWWKCWWNNNLLAEKAGEFCMINGCRKQILCLNQHGRHMYLHLAFCFTVWAQKHSMRTVMQRQATKAQE